VGDLLVQQGDLPHALQSYKAMLGINERLAKAEPSNSSWQFGLSASQGKIGSVLWASGDRAGALANYHKALAAAEMQAAIVEAKEVKDAGKPGGATAQALGLSVAWSALFARDFEKALAATERARMLAPDQIQSDSNRAHALLLLKRTREATTLYMAHKGQMVSGGLWEDVIANDFEELRKGGLGNTQMAKIEARLGLTPR
jgi:tetratricopeptide (TPR) repeat protein